MKTGSYVGLTRHAVTLRTRTLLVFFLTFWALTLAPELSGQMVTGSYTGNAADNRSFTTAGFQPDVPEHADEPLDARRVLRRRIVREQDQHVDVGGREELAAAVAAGRDERRFDLRRGRAPDLLQRAIDEARVLAQ